MHKRTKTPRLIVAVVCGFLAAVLLLGIIFLFVVPGDPYTALLGLSRLTHICTKCGAQYQRTAFALLGHEFPSERILEVSEQTILEGVSVKDCRHHYNRTGTFILEIARDGSFNHTRQGRTGGDSFYAAPQLKTALSSIARTNADDAQRIFGQVVDRRNYRLANGKAPPSAPKPQSSVEAELYKLAEESPVTR